MSRNLALEKVGRARVAYMLQQRGWKVGEAFDDGYDLLAFHPTSKKTSLHRTQGNGHGEPFAWQQPDCTCDREKHTCTHIIVYVEPQGWVFITLKRRLSPQGQHIRCPGYKGNLRQPKEGEEEFHAVQEQMGRTSSLMSSPSGDASGDITKMWGRKECC